MTLEEALEASGAEPVNDIFLINPETRVITVPASEKLFGVANDGNSERKHFRCPKIVGDNIDLSTMHLYINYQNANGQKYPYLVEDVQTDGDYITFSWLIGPDVVAYKGQIKFIVCAKKGDGTIPEWNTTLAEGTVLEGMEATDEVVARNPDIIEQILKKIDELTSISPDDIATAVEEYMANNPIEETDPTVPDWAKQPEKPSYTALEVGADTAGTAESKVSAHNVSDTAHNDIRLLVQGLTERLNALADSDDTTLDQMSEVVAYIKSNKSLIDAITTSKINVSDIIDNLTTNVSNKPLSAAQGVKLKALIDAIIVPTKLSELENDSGYAKTTDIPDKLPNPQKLTFAGAVTAEYDGLGAVTVTIPEGSGGSGGTVRIEKLSTDTAVELEPNKLYIFPEMTELTITLGEPSDTGIANEYHFVFQSGATATTLSIPDAIKIPSGFSVDVNKIYEISIMESCLCHQSWEVTV